MLERRCALSCSSILHMGNESRIPVTEKRDETCKERLAEPAGERSAVLLSRRSTPEPADLGHGRPGRGGCPGGDQIKPRLYAAVPIRRSPGASGLAPRRLLPQLGLGPGGSSALVAGGGSPWLQPDAVACLGKGRDPWHDRSMPWAIKRRWWILAGGLVLVLVALVPSGPVTDARVAAGAVGFFLVSWGVLAVLLAIPIALRGRHEAHRPPDSSRDTGL